MGDVVFARTEKLAAPPVPQGEVSLQAPPALPRPTPRPLIQIVLPIVLVVAVVGMVVVMMRTGMMRNPMFMLFPVMMAVSAVGMLAGTLTGGNKTAETDELRKDYLRYLGQTRDTVRETAAAQREAALWRHPDPVELPAMVGTARMWERDQDDPDDLTIRVGPGRQALATPLSAPDTGPVDDLEPVSVVSMRRFVRVHSVVDELPVALELRAFAALSLDGEVDTVRSAVRAMLAGLVVAHGPDRVRIAVAASEGETRRAWEWLKWLPHHEHAVYTDGGGRVRLTEFSLAGAESMLGTEISARPRSRDGHTSSSSWTAWGSPAPSGSWRRTGWTASPSWRSRGAARGSCAISRCAAVCASGSTTTGSPASGPSTVTRTSPGSTR